MLRVLLTIAIVGIVGIVALSSLPASAQPATPAVTDPSCGELQDYWEALNQALPEVSAETDGSLLTVRLVPLSDLSTVRSEHLTATAAYIEELATNVEAIDDVPAVVVRLHEEYVVRLVLLARVMVAQSEARVFDAMVLIEQVNANAEVMRDQIHVAASTCGEQWTEFGKRHPTAYPFMWSLWWYGDAT